MRSGKMGRFLGTGEILQFEKGEISDLEMDEWDKKLKKEKGFVNEV